MSVLISRQGVPASPIGALALRRRAERMLLALALADAELSIVLCDDATIHGLNRAHRKHDKPTDVLAFALREGKALKGAEGMLGDVVISLDTARRQAAQHDRALWDEVTMLLAHGLLHLIGYDHRTDAEERRMNARADMLIAAASAGRPQARASIVDKPARAGDSRARRGAPKAPAKRIKRK